jgi:hypothetical protein
MTPAPPSPPSTIRIHGTLQARGPAAALVLTDTQVQSICPGKKTASVSVTVNSHTFAGRIARMHSETLIGFNKAVRDACGVAAGDEIHADVTLDLSPREVELPKQLVAAFADHPDARDAFQKLAPSHRKEFARWISEAKRDDTRTRRVHETLSMLQEGRTRS